MQQPNRGVWQKVEKTAGLATIVALVVTLVQLWQSKLASDAQDIAQSTQIVLLLQQLNVQQELATLQANSISVGPTSTQIAAEIEALQSTAVALSTLQASISPFSVNFKVEAKKAWTDTNILISQGDVISVKWVTGNWRTDSNNDWTDGFDCRSEPCVDCFSRESPEGSLLMKVGSGGNVQCAGDSNYTSSTAGNLWLSFNDHANSFYDNQGEVVVQITVRHE